MRSPAINWILSSALAGTMLVCLPAHGQIFPTLDPNAPPPVTTRLDPLPQPKTAPPPDVKPAKAVSPDTTTKPTSATAASPTLASVSADVYVLGAQDVLSIRVVDMEEFNDSVYPLDLSGFVTLPRLGRVQAAGLTVEQLQAELVSKLKDYLQEPVVTITITEFHSQPVSILGAVENPGVHQIRGNKTLYEVISEAGGLKDDAGNKITITRQLTNGPLPLSSAHSDESGRFSIAELNIRSVMSAHNPQDNIAVKPNDIITVPKADLIYVIGAVKRPGGFPLQERANMTVLEALSLSQGLDHAAKANKSKIIRTDEVTQAKVEIPIDVQSILNGKGTDTALLSNDILFVPTSAAKQASLRALEALVQAGTGIAIYK